MINIELLAWGERGHDLIARVAIRLLRYKKMPHAMRRPFEKREHMLGHLANCPDIAWKQLPRKVTHFINPTHWIGLDHLSKNPDLKLMPKNIGEFLNLVHLKEPLISSKESLDVQKLKIIGSAPFRVEELSHKAITIFKKKINSRITKEQSNEILLYLGLLAHYVGDLANPHHTVSDYDSWKAKQGGLHAYFESALVNSLSLGLDYAVFKEAKENKPAQKIINTLENKNKRNNLMLTWALVIDSYQNYPRLLKLDRDYALIKESKYERGMKIRATRKNPYEVNQYFKDFIIQRLALAADLLSHIWILTWLAGGKVDQSHFHSYKYFYKPKLLIPSYYPPTLKQEILSNLK